MASLQQGACQNVARDGRGRRRIRNRRRAGRPGNDTRDGRRPLSGMRIRGAPERAGVAVLALEWRSARRDARAIARAPIAAQVSKE